MVRKIGKKEVQGGGWLPPPADPPSNFRAKTVGLI